MLDLGRGPIRNCQGVGRRAFLRLGTLGMAGFTLGDLLAARALGGGESPTPTKARAVIVLWLWGGPSHLDTFDPNPDPPLESRGPSESIAPRAPGLRANELPPGIPRHADKLALIRSMHHESND